MVLTTSDGGVVMMVEFRCCQDVPAETPISSEPLMVPISVLIPSLTNSGSEQKYFQREKK